jgi:hypothetical protein
MSDELARKHKWIVLQEEETYTKQLTLSSSIFIFREPDDTWTVWRANWTEGQPKPISEKTIFAGGTFEQALKRANDYVEWRSKAFRKRK